MPRNSVIGRAVKKLFLTEPDLSDPNAILERLKAKGIESSSADSISSFRSNFRATLRALRDLGVLTGVAAELDLGSSEGPKLWILRFNQILFREPDLNVKELGNRLSGEGFDDVALENLQSTRSDCRGSLSVLREHEAILELDPKFSAQLSPARRERILEEFKRNAKNVTELKDMYKNNCQICGSIPFDGDLGAISEAHHIKWLACGGSDTLDNVVLICPNHHSAIHAQAATFDWTTLTFQFGPAAAIRLKLNSHLNQS